MGYWGTLEAGTPLAFKEALDAPLSGVGLGDLLDLLSPKISP